MPDTLITINKLNPGVKLDVISGMAYATDLESKQYIIEDRNLNKIRLVYRSRKLMYTPLTIDFKDKRLTIVWTVRGFIAKGEGIEDTEFVIVSEDRKR